MFTIQKASIWKRISAGTFDLIMLVILSVAFGLIISTISGYDKHNDNWANYMNKYETLYDVDLKKVSSEDALLSLSKDEQERMEAAYLALIEDENALKEYNTVVNLSLVIVTFGILFAFLIWEFAIPLFLKNGQTLGKKIFGLGLMQEIGVKINTPQLFIRVLLGKYTIEAMIPVLFVVLLYFNNVTLTGIIIVAAILLSNLVMIITSPNKKMIHDLLAGTVVIDLPTQRIFNSKEEMIKAKEEYYAAQAAKQPY